MSKRFKVGMQVRVNSDKTGVGPLNKSVADMGFKNGETVELINYDSKDETWEVKSLRGTGVRMWIKRKHLAPIEAEPAANPFKVGDKVELINERADWASSDNVTTGVEYTVSEVYGPAHNQKDPVIRVIDNGARGVYWIESKYFKLATPKPAVPERAWKIGDQFKVYSSTVYTIEESPIADRVKISWVYQNDPKKGQYDSMLYDVADLDKFFSNGAWKLIEKTNIQENVSPIQTPDVPLQHTKTQTTMAKQTALPVSPAFIIEAHKVACSDWKTKLEQMYPSVFLPAQTFKVGDRVQFPQASAFLNATYLLANTGGNHMGLINLQTGRRWMGLVKVGNESAITPEEMAKLCYGQKLETILVNGTTPTLNTKPSTDKTLMAQVSDIKAAYQATSDKGTKRMIKDYFHEAFSKYVQLTPTDNGSVTLSTITETIDGVDFIIGRGMAPREELCGACIGVPTDQAVVEIITHSGRTWVAFKKK